MTTKNVLNGYDKVQCTILLLFGIFIFTQCTKAEVDTSQVRPAPKHASEMIDEPTPDGNEPSGPTVLFPVGGGTISDATMTTFLAESPLQQPRVLIIPHAYDRPTTQNSLQSQITRFTNQFSVLGIQNIEVLDLSSPQGALTQINRADVIWMSGGYQNTLRDRLNATSTQLIPAIKNRYNSGQAIVGGTSAGAAIVSEVMINGDGGNSATSPGNVQIQVGAGLWPEVIVDQHFTQRTRMWRLENAISRNPTLIGIGIDEETGALLKNKTQFTVVGPGTITVLRQIGSQQQATVLNTGDVYQIPIN